MTMNLNKMADEIHQLSKSKGWWDDTTVQERIFMIGSEVFEAIAELRSGNNLETKEELIDVLIRTLDILGWYGYDIEAALLAKHEHNKTRSYKHGKGF